MDKLTKDYERDLENEDAPLRTEECDACQGHGQYQKWDGGMFHDCEECNGTGEIEC